MTAFVTFLSRREVCGATGLAGETNFDVYTSAESG